MSVMEAWVELSLIEMIQGGLTGAARLHDAIVNNRKPAYPCPPEQTMVNAFAGAFAEIAVAKYRGIYWGGHVDTWKGPDLGSHIQVRSRPNHDWDLPVFPNANDDDLYVLVTGVAPRLCIRGAILAREAKREEWLQDYGGKGIKNHFVPQGELHAFERRAA